MVQPDPQPVPQPQPEPNPQVGPYDAAVNGLCAAGHPLNGEGRCQPLNDGVGQ